MAESLNIRVLEVIHQERAAFGLRSHDYGRYRKHCASKLHRSRQCLHLTHGHGREFKKTVPPPSDAVTDAHLLLQLFDVERAYAHAQELLMSDDADRHHGIARFRRAATYSSRLVASAPRLSLVPRAELYIYHLITLARLSLARRDDSEYETALVRLATSSKTLGLLAQAAPTSRDVALYTSFLDSISAEIRFLAHELGHPRAWDIDAVVADVKPSESESVWEGYGDAMRELEAMRASKVAKGELKELMWEGKPVPVREPELVDALVSVQKAEASLKQDHNEGAKNTKPGEKKKKKSRHRGLIAAYDDLLLSLSDAEALARRLSTDARAAASASGSPAPDSRDITFLHSFLLYRLLTTRTARDLLLVKLLESPPPNSAASKAKGKQVSYEPDDKTSMAILKTLDSILQSLDQVRVLPIVEESPAIAEGVDARTAFVRTKRIILLAKYYSSQSQYGEALALLSRGEFYLRAHPTDPMTASSPDELAFFELSSTATSAMDKLATLALQLKKDWYGKLYPKPVFYDVALNYIPMGNIRERAGLAAQPVTSSAQKGTQGVEKGGSRADVVLEKEEAEQEQKETRSGWSGYLGSWWGRK